MHASIRRFCQRIASHLPISENPARSLLCTLCALCALFRPRRAPCAAFYPTVVGWFRRARAAYSTLEVWSLVPPQRSALQKVPPTHQRFARLDITRQPALTGTAHQNG